MARWVVNWILVPGYTQEGKVQSQLRFEESTSWIYKWDHSTEKQSTRVNIQKCLIAHILGNQKASLKIIWSYVAIMKPWDIIHLNLWLITQTLPTHPSINNHPLKQTHNWRNQTPPLLCLLCLRRNLSCLWRDCSQNFNFSFNHISSKGENP